MENLESFLLYDDRTGPTWIILRCNITDGRLRFEGHDLGEAPMAYVGRDEYEYSYTLSVNDTNRIVGLLTSEGNDLKAALIEKFSGVEGCSRFRDFCETHGLKCEFWSWP